MFLTKPIPHLSTIVLYRLVIAVMKFLIRSNLGEERCILAPSSDECSHKDSQLREMQSIIVGSHQGSQLRGTLFWGRYGGRMA